MSSRPCEGEHFELIEVPIILCSIRRWKKAQQPLSLSFSAFFGRKLPQLIGKAFSASGAIPNRKLK